MLRLSMKRASIITQAIRVNGLILFAERVEEGEDGLGRLLNQRGKAAGDLRTEADDLDQVSLGLGQLEQRQTRVIRMRFELLGWVVVPQRWPARSGPARRTGPVQSVRTRGVRGPNVPRESIRGA